MGSLELRDLTVCYGEREVLHGLNLEVPEGQQVALVGPNGSGKTTLLRALAGIAPAARGSAIPATGLTRRQIARHVAFLPQEEHWEFAFSVDEVVRCGRFAFQGAFARETSEDLAAVEEALAAVGLSDLRTRPITELSGGERRRVVLARALAQKAPSLLLDEPTTALDLEHKQAVLRALAASGGTVLFATHDLDAAAAYAERIVVLDKGRVAADGVPAEVLTEALLKDVFHVHAQIVRDGDRIHVVTDL